MLIRRLTPLLALFLTACAGGEGSSQQDPGFHLPIPHINLSSIGIGQTAPTGHLEKSAFSQTPVQLWADTTLGPDCTPIGVTQLEVSAPPAHGVVSIRSGRLYALYPKGHPRDYCSGRLVTGMLAIYTAEKDYAGSDKVVLRAVTSDGVLQRVAIDIRVQPRAVGIAKPRPAPVNRPNLKTLIAPDASPPPEEAISPPTVRDPTAPAPQVMRTPFPNG